MCNAVGTRVPPFRLTSGVQAADEGEALQGASLHSMLLLYDGEAPLLFTQRAGHILTYKR